MTIDQDRFSTALSIVLKSGVAVYPVHVKQRDTGEVAFRISRGGNTRQDSENVDEATMLQRVRSGQYAVRCSSRDGKTQGLYKIHGRSVASVR